MRHLRKALDFILPPRCIVSGEIVDYPGMISPKAWSELNFITDPLCQSCGIPFEFSEDGNELLCGACLEDPPSFTQARAALRYDDVSRDMILGFKHGDQTYAVKTFMPWLMRAGAEFFKKTNYIIPVPLHFTRLMKRRYNQAGIIAHYLSAETGLPILPGAIVRTRSTQSQGHLKHAERKKNVKKAFSVNPKYKDILQGQDIALIDDVYTTGATVKECSKVLKEMGVESVYVLTLARVIKPNYTD